MKVRRGRNGNNSYKVLMAHEVVQDHGKVDCGKLKMYGIIPKLTSKITK